LLIARPEKAITPLHRAAGSGLARVRRCDIVPPENGFIVDGQRLGGFMQLSRRSALAYGSALAAAAQTAVPTLAYGKSGFRNATRFQLVQHLFVHADEAEGGPYTAALSFAAPDTAWKTALQSGDDFLAAHAAYRLRGYGLRRLSGFETKNGTRYAAIWQYGLEGADRVRHDMTPAAFRNNVDRFATEGYVLSHVDASATGSGPRFAAIWDRSSGPAPRVVADLTAAQFRAQCAALKTEGLRPLQVAGYTSAGEARFAAVFARDTGQHRQIELAVPAVDFHAHSMIMIAQGHRLRDASGYVVGKQPFYTAVWERT
jgi:hypothetical protein